MTTTAKGTLEIAAEILGLDAAALAARATVDSFVALGGTSLHAFRLLSRTKRTLGLRLPLASVLGETPVAEALDAATPAPAPTPRHRSAVAANTKTSCQHRTGC
jgi:hypothetical protein